MLSYPIACDRVVEQPYQECNRAWNVNEGIQPVDVSHQCGIAHEEMLDWQFPEDMQLLLEFDNLQSMSSCNVNGTFDYRYRSKSSA